MLREVLEGMSAGNPLLLRGAEKAAHYSKERLKTEWETLRAKRRVTMSRVSKKTREKEAKRTIR